MKKFLLILILILTPSISVFSQVGSACWREISAGQNFTLGIKADGTLWGWGQNGNLLGLGYFSTSENLPIQIGTANDWMAVSAGANHSLAVKTNGTLWAWGSGLFGQLGNGAFNNATFNVTQVGTATNWLKVSAGTQFSLALKNTGTLWSWGLNNTGQLGDGTTTNTNLPNQVGISINWQTIEAGDQHSLAIDNGGILYSWGNNTFGQLGDGTYTTVLNPNVISTLFWTAISAGFDHSMALGLNGALHTWGNNSNGQLCDAGANPNVNVPTLILNPTGTVTGYIVISAGTAFSLAIRNDSTLHSSGGNVFGQLAQGNNAPLNVLTQVGTNSNWMAISAGNTHFASLDTSTSLFNAGRDWEGQIAQGTNIFSYQSVQSVACPSTLSINELVSNKLDIKVYPNPTNNFINIDFNLQNSEKITLKLMTILGQIIQEISVNKSNGFNNETIDLSNQSSGIYFISVASETSNFVSKVIKR